MLEKYLKDFMKLCVRFLERKYDLDHKAVKILKIMDEKKVEIGGKKHTFYILRYRLSFV